MDNKLQFNLSPTLIQDFNEIFNYFSALPSSLSDTTPQSINSQDRINSISELFQSVNIEYLDADPTNKEYLKTYISNKIITDGLNDSAVFLNLGDVIRRMKIWLSNMPTITPYYAVKCNPSPVILSLLANMGAGFDCASIKEMELILSLGVNPEKIIFSVPSKQISHIIYAREKGVLYTTIDSVFELNKLSVWYPKIQLLLRIRADDLTARCELGNKFGCEMEEVEDILKAAKTLNLSIVGVHFHVGSGASDENSFKSAIIKARKVFDIAVSYGFNMRLLDIGGGFPGYDQTFQTAIQATGKVINTTLESEFKCYPNIQIFSEPGRFFAESFATLITLVYGKKASYKSNTHYQYYVTDGLYGSFNNIIYDHAAPLPSVLYDPRKKNQNDSTNYNTTIFGPTCDGLDTICRNIQLPEINMDDWLCWNGMGAYTFAAGSKFNGLDCTVDNKKHYYLYTDC